MSEPKCPYCGANGRESIPAGNGYTYDCGTCSLPIRHFEPRGMKWRNWPLPSVWLGTINHHIKAIYEDGELSPEATIRQYRIVQSEGARPAELDWFRSLRDQCCDAYVPFFMKQIDKKQPIPDDLMVREYPNA